MDKNPFLRFLVNDWYISIPMVCMSLTGLALVVWRILLNINGKTTMDEFLPVFQNRLEKEGPEGALRYCKSRDDIIPRRLYAAGLETSKQGMAAMRRAMANVIELEIVPDLNFLLPPILAIAKIATMVGLLGTVISMIGTFSKISTTTHPAEQAGNIGLALFATALGLVTAIPLVFSHVLLKAWVARSELRMKAAAQKLLLLMQNAKSGAGAAAKPAASPSAAQAKVPVL
ncbi:MAG: MotA/TolQ/ExbB proton channel family protein [Gemmataceae bacterium]